MKKKVWLAAGALVLAMAGCGEDFEWLPADDAGGGSTTTAVKYDAGTFSDATENANTGGNTDNRKYRITTEGPSSSGTNIFYSDTQLTCTNGDAVKYVEFLNTNSEKVGKQLEACGQIAVIELDDECKHCTGPQ